MGWFVVLVVFSLLPCLLGQDEGFTCRVDSCDDKIEALVLRFSLGCGLSQDEGTCTSNIQYQLDSIVPVDAEQVFAARVAAVSSMASSFAFQCRNTVLCGMNSLWDLDQAFLSLGRVHGNADFLVAQANNASVKWPGSPGYTWRVYYAADTNVAHLRRLAGVCSTAACSNVVASQLALRLAILSNAKENLLISDWPTYANRAYTGDPSFMTIWNARACQNSSSPASMCLSELTSAWLSSPTPQAALELARAASEVTPSSCESELKANLSHCVGCEEYVVLDESYRMWNDAMWKLAQCGVAHFSETFVASMQSASDSCWVGCRGIFLGRSLSLWALKMRQKAQYDLMSLFSLACGGNQTCFQNADASRRALLLPLPRFVMTGRNSITLFAIPDRIYVFFEILLAAALLVVCVAALIFGFWYKAWQYLKVFCFTLFGMSVLSVLRIIIWTLVSASESISGTNVGFNDFNLSVLVEFLTNITIWADLVASCIVGLILAFLLFDWIQILMSLSNAGQLTQRVISVSFWALTVAFVVVSVILCGLLLYLPNNITFILQVVVFVWLGGYASTLMVMAAYGLCVFKRGDPSFDAALKFLACVGLLFVGICLRQAFAVYLSTFLPSGAILPFLLGSSPVVSGLTIVAEILISVPFVFLAVAALRAFVIRETTTAFNDDTSRSVPLLEKTPQQYNY